MLTTTPHLITRRPSPTTVEYTVSTSPPQTYTFRLLLTLTILSRLLLGFSLLFLLYSKFLLSSYASARQLPSSSAPALLSLEHVSYQLLLLTSSRLGSVFSFIAAKTPLVVLLPTTGTLLYILTLRPHTNESLLILRGLGIQTSSSSASYLSSSTTRFIPTEKIQDILVNEAFRGWEVRYYLVVVVEGEESVVVVFPRLLPRRRVVEEVWRGARACLFDREKADRDKRREMEDKASSPMM
jgi:phosphatidylinositol glycan class H protein